MRAFGHVRRYSVRVRFLEDSFDERYDLSRAHSDCFDTGWRVVGPIGQYPRAGAAQRRATRPVRNGFQSDLDRDNKRSNRPRAGGPQPIKTMNSLALLAAVSFGSGGLISLLIWLLVAAIVVYVIFLILGMLPLPPQIKTIATLIIGLIVLLVLLNHLNIV
jgi:hypothetical protein